MSDERPKLNPNYFRLPKPIEGTFVVLLMVLFYFTLYHPESVVLDYFGPLGSLGRYLNKNYYGLLKMILYTSFVIHFGEAVYAGSLCKKKGINYLTSVMWTTQTFVIGFPSLMQIVAYKPGRKSS